MRVSGVSFAYEKKEVLSEISFEIEKKKITVILGANGSGKSTLFGLMTKNLKPNKGSIYLHEQNISEMKLRSFSREVAIVHQHNKTDDDMTVEKMVSYGRLPYARRFQGKSKEDEEAIRNALEMTNLYNIRECEMGKLSGGQRQRAFIAMALAQRTGILLLDEPTTFLDIRYQIEILELIKRLNMQWGLTVVMVLHDINQAVSYSDNLIGLKDGKVVTRGRTKEVISQESLHDLYDINLDVVTINEKKVILTM